MTLRQRRMLTIVALAIGGVLFWPPVNVPVSPTETELEYVSLFSGFDGSIDFHLLIAEILSLCLVGIVSYRVVGRGN